VNQILYYDLDSLLFLCLRGQEVQAGNSRCNVNGWLGVFVLSSCLPNVIKISWVDDPPQERQHGSMMGQGGDVTSSKKIMDSENA
jgi:hypothetical protein